MILDILIVDKISPFRIGQMLCVGDVVLEKRFDAVIDFAEVSVILPELGRIAIDSHELIFVGQFSIVELVGVVGLGEYI